MSRPASQIAGENLDLELALSRVGGDIDLLKEIAHLFVQDYPKVLMELHQAVDSGDTQAVERTAHGLKGSVSTFGARAAMEAARTLENLGRARQTEELPQVLHKLELALTALRPELESL